MVFPPLFFDEILLNKIDSIDLKGFKVFRERVAKEANKSKKNWIKWRLLHLSFGLDPQNNKTYWHDVYTNLECVV